MSCKGSMDNVTNIQRSNWKGSIPIMLSLAPSSLSSPSMPSPVHCMISRQTYLHMALESEVQRFHEYAPMVVNFQSVDQSSPSTGDDVGDDEVTTGNNSHDGRNGNGISEESDGNVDDKTSESYPMCWFEDEDTGTPLRWHFFTGLLYDLFKLYKKKRAGVNDGSVGMDSNKCVSLLPWKIRVHYTSYPENILPLDDDTPQMIFQHYLNSLKQALYIQHNSNRIVKNMTKQSHLQIWDGIKSSQFDVYKEITTGLNGGGSSGDAITIENVPVRVLVDSRPAFARPCKQYQEDNKTPSMIGDILHEWLPDLFPNDTRNNDISNCSWSIQGVKFPLKTPISDLWKCLSHPDRFLYVIIVTNE